MGIKKGKIIMSEQQDSKYKNDLISVIMPCYNSENTVSESIISILSQSFVNFELIVVDDGSIDGTTQVIKRLLIHDSRIKLIALKENKGVHHARNVGINFSNGRFLAFCDSDDLWHTIKLEIQIAALLYTKYAVCCSSYYIIDEFGKKTGSRQYKAGAIEYEEMLSINKIGNLTGVIDLNKIEKKPLQKDIKHEDFLMWLEILKDKGPAVCIEQPLAYYRKHSNSLSSNKFKGVIWHLNVLREHELNTFSALKKTISGRINLLFQRCSSRQ
jgi:teichuronic acid biosynthesis glycosyltransferase TuaG